MKQKKFKNFQECDQRGSAVMVTLFFLFLMVVIALTMFYVTRISKELASNHADQKRAYYQAVSAMERAFAYLSDVAPVTTGKKDAEGNVTFYDPSFSPAHFVNPLTNTWFFNNDGIFVYPTKVDNTVHETEFKIINHTGKFDINWNRRPLKDENASWNKPTFGNTPYDINLDYLLPNRFKWYTTSIDNRWIGINEIRKEIYAREHRTEKNLATLPLISFSPYGSPEQFRSNMPENLKTASAEDYKTEREQYFFRLLKNNYLHHSNTYLDRKGEIHCRVSLEDLANRVMSLPLGEVVMFSEKDARAVRDYLGHFYPKHVEREKELEKLIAEQEERLDSYYDEASWKEINNLRDDIRSLSSQISSLRQKIALAQEYGTGNYGSESHTNYVNSTQLPEYQQQLQELTREIEAKREELQNIVAEAAADNEGLPKTYQELEEELNHLNSMMAEQRRHQYSINIFEKCREKLMVMDNFHAETMKILTKNKTSPIPSLTRILEYYYENDCYQEYLDFLAVLRDYFDGETYGNSQVIYGEMTTGTGITRADVGFYLPKDWYFQDANYEKEFEAKWGYPSSELHNRYYHYTGIESGPVISKIRFYCIFGWRLGRSITIPGVNGAPPTEKKIYNLYVRIYPSFLLMNPTPELSIPHVSGSFRDIAFQLKGRVNDTDKIISKTQTFTFSGKFNSVSIEDNKWLEFVPQNYMQIELGEVEEGRHINNLELSFDNIRECTLHMRMYSSIYSMLTDSIKLNNQSATYKISPTAIGLPAAEENGVSSSAVIFDFESDDALCNGIGKYWIFSKSIVAQNDANRYFDGSRPPYTPIFIRNSVPKSLWELVNIHRGSPHLFLNMFPESGSETPDGSYAQGDWELFDHLAFDVESIIQDNQAFEMADFCEHGKINPNIQHRNIWEVILSSVRLAEWDFSFPYPELYPPYEYYPGFYKHFRALTGSDNEEVAYKGYDVRQVASQLMREQIKPLRTRGQLALRHASLFANINTTQRVNYQRRNEILGKIIPLLQTRYQYFEIVAVGRDCKPLAEVDQIDGVDKIIKAECTIRVFVERDAFTGTIRPLTYEIDED